MQYYWEVFSMRVAYLMSGTKGDEAHKKYKEGDGNHRRHFDYFLCLVFYDFLHASAV